MLIKVGESKTGYNIFGYDHDDSTRAQKTEEDMIFWNSRIDYINGK